MKMLETERGELPRSATHKELSNRNGTRWEANGCLGQRITGRVWVGTPGVEALVIIDTGRMKYGSRGGCVCFVSAE